VREEKRGRKGERERERRRIQLHLSEVYSCIGCPYECACISVCSQRRQVVDPGARSTLHYTYSKLHKTHDADALQAVSNLI